MENIEKNKDIIANKFALKKENICILDQGFSNIVHYIDKASQYELVGDGIVTKEKNIILGVSTADCVPVLFADYENNIIGAAHAGWRSALAGIIENTCKLMIKKGANLEKISIAIGPCLQKKSFESGEDMRQEFIKKDSNFEKYFTPSENKKYLFDMEQFAKDKALSIGVKNTSTSSIDTYSNQTYFSYRRNTHKKIIAKVADFPTQLSCIVL